MSRSGKRVRAVLLQIQLPYMSGLQPSVRVWQDTWAFGPGLPWSGPSALNDTAIGTLL